MIPAPILTVSQINQHVRAWLEHEMGMVNIEGEISNLSKPSSGHYYFTLKDANAQLRCVYFRNRHLIQTNNGIQNGQQVVVSGTLSLYEARGDFQLIVHELEEAGLGDLFRQFELLKAKLKAQGLFDTIRKKPIPYFPTCIGIITSPTGAAIQDIQKTINRRFHIARIVLYPCEVQGTKAALQIIQAIKQANLQKHCDVLILARGGGSLEDLWPFNDENLAHAIAQSKIPIVTGIGHETDFTIADFVADLRAATPTAAAEATTPPLNELHEKLQTYLRHLSTAIFQVMKHQRLLLQHEMDKLTSPKQLIYHYWQTIDYIQNHLKYAVQQFFMQKRQCLQQQTSSLEALNPRSQLINARSNLTQLEQQLTRQMDSNLQQRRQRFVKHLAILQTVSPLATLQRGYAIVSHHQHIILSEEEVNIGDTIHITLAKGTLTSNVSGKTSS